MCLGGELEIESCSVTSCRSWGRSLGIPSPSSFLCNSDNRNGTYLVGLQMKKFKKELRRVPDIGSVLPNVDDYYVPG